MRFAFMSAMEMLLKIWPTIAAIANDLGKPYQTVAAWGSQNRRVPPSVYPELIRAAKARGCNLTYEMLASECSGQGGVCNPQPEAATSATGAPE